jgi:hypothetical protein
MTMKRLVVVGNGMAGVACVEQILKYSPRFEITIFGDETHVNYNRILLSSVLAGEKTADDIALNPIEWYEENGIRLRARAGDRRRCRREDRYRRRRQRDGVRRPPSCNRQLCLDAADRGARQGRRLRLPYA